MKFLIPLVLLFSLSARAELPPVITLDTPVLPFALVDAVQVLYAPFASTVLVRVRWQASADVAPTIYCMAIKPTAYPPPGVAQLTWVSAGQGIVTSNAYGTNMLPFWRGICAN